MTVSPGGQGLWAGFLDRLPAAEAMKTVRDIEIAGVSTIWLQEYSGTDANRAAGQITSSSSSCRRLRRQSC
ncbi:hypothetical protein [Mycobacterium sp. RTGN4]|uniref:hypothetical protein n=1 Tax=Mycobacterium sp. RTGN4 TaxID=3016523 RepID=UPI0029C79A0A|nr:hypothetical protein [Mycobacterium sp. RTGN4]